MNHQCTPLNGLRDQQKRLAQFWVHFSRAQMYFLNAETPLKFSADSSGLPAKKGQTGKLEKHDSKHDSWCYDSMLSGSGYD